MTQTIHKETMNDESYKDSLVSKYTPKTTAQIDIVNPIKEKETELITMVDELINKILDDAGLLKEEFRSFNPIRETEDTVKLKWLREGRMDIQKGVMAVCRAVFMPKDE